MVAICLQSSHVAEAGGTCLGYIGRSCLKRKRACMYVLLMGLGGGGSVGRALALQVQGPASDLQSPHENTRLAGTHI